MHADALNFALRLALQGGLAYAGEASAGAPEPPFWAVFSHSRWPGFFFLAVPGDGGPIVAALVHLSSDLPVGAERSLRRSADRFVREMHLGDEGRRVRCWKLLEADEARALAIGLCNANEETTSRRHFDA